MSYVGHGSVCWWVIGHKKWPILSPLRYGRQSQIFPPQPFRQNTGLCHRDRQTDGRRVTAYSGIYARRHIGRYSRACVMVTCGGKGGTRWRRRSELVDARIYEKCEAIIFIDKSTCISYRRKPHMLNMHHTFWQSVTRIVRNCSSKYNVTRNRIRPLAVCVTVVQQS